MTGGGGLGGGGGESASGLIGGCGVIANGLRGSGVIVIEADLDKAKPENDTLIIYFWQDIRDLD